jgi:hypothetical protein
MRKVGHPILRSNQVVERLTVAPMAIQIPSASHSYTVKWPGIAGTIFISSIAAATTNPKTAIDRWDPDSLDWSGNFPERPSHRYAAQVAAHPRARPRNRLL